MEKAESFSVAKAAEEFRSTAFTCADVAGLLLINTTSQRGQVKQISYELS